MANNIIRVRGVGRVGDEPRAVLVCLTDIPSDHWIRNFHDAIRDWHPLAPPLPAEPEDGNGTERAFEKWWNDPRGHTVAPNRRQQQMADPTPGPWEVRLGDSRVFIDSWHGGIASIGQQPYFKHFAETDVANARLMAAAPDLLNALGNLLNCVDGVHDQEWLTRCKNEARAAIAKARGQS